MDKSAFDAIFDEVTLGPLSSRGFVRRRGTSCYAEIRGVQVAWVRGGGRLSVSGSIAHCICFRHAFLRDKEGKVPSQPPGYPEEYPWVFDPEKLPGSSAKDWQFDASRLMALPYGRYSFAGLDEATVRSDIESRLAAFLRYTDWALQLSLMESQAQLLPYADEYWVARHWLQDYRAREGDVRGRTDSH